MVSIDFIQCQYSTTFGNWISATRNSGCPSDGSRMIEYTGSGALKHTPLHVKTEGAVIVKPVYTNNYLPNWSRNILAKSRLCKHPCKANLWHDCVVQIGVGSNYTVGRNFQAVANQQLLRLTDAALVVAFHQSSSRDWHKSIYRTCSV